MHLGSGLVSSALACLSWLTVAACCANIPTATLKNGTYTGRYNTEYDQDFFLGVPFAKTAERFTVAQRLDEAWNGTRPAVNFSPDCLNYVVVEQGIQVSEDCLYLNIVRPAGVTNTSDLPVAVWIHGGNFIGGGSSYKRYNMSFVVDQSVRMGTPVIGVSINYRLSAFGFLSGGEARTAGIANNGIRDQRLALEWLQENIAAFGGSPNKVTIFGESAGAISSTLHVLAYNGRDDGLFRGVIGQSGFGSTIPGPITLDDTEGLDQVYSSLVAATSCVDLLTQSSGTLDCLRKLPQEELDYALNVTKVGPWIPVIDGDILQDHPTSQLSRGDFVKVPLLVGVNTDEGTDHALTELPPVQDDDTVRAILSSVVSGQKTNQTTAEIVDELMLLYPNDQTVGIPSLETWPHVIRPGDSYAEQIGAQYRRISALVGDISMHWQRRRANQIWHQHGLPTWSYRFNVRHINAPEYRGSSHTDEIAFVLHNTLNAGLRNPIFVGDEPYLSQAIAVADEMTSAWINFFNSLDPNDDATAWPLYGPVDGEGVGHNLVFDLGGSHVEVDDYRTKEIGWIIDHALPVFGV